MIWRLQWGNNGGQKKNERIAWWHRTDARSLSMQMRRPQIEGAEACQVERTDVCNAVVVGVHTTLGHLKTENFSSFSLDNKCVFVDQNAAATGNFSLLPEKKKKMASFACLHKDMQIGMSGLLEMWSLQIILFFLLKGNYWNYIIKDIFIIWARHSFWFIYSISNVWSKWPDLRRQDNDRMEHDYWKKR